MDTYLKYAWLMAVVSDMLATAAVGASDDVMLLKTGKTVNALNQFMQ